MAGLGEVCSHVGAVLFAVEAGVRMLKAKTCTSVPCQWLMPLAVSNVPYAELQEIDFTSSYTKKRKLDERISGLTPQSTPVKPRTAYGPSTQQISKFYECLILKQIYFNKYMLFVGWEVGIVKNCDRGLENAA